MSKRIELLTQLVNMDDSIEYLVSKLADFGWDSEENLILINRQNIINILNKFLNGEVDSSIIENWAEAIECREDIGFDLIHEELIREIIFDLANSEITGILSRTKAELLMLKLGHTP